MICWSQQDKQGRGSATKGLCNGHSRAVNPNPWLGQGHRTRTSSPGHSPIVWRKTQGALRSRFCLSYWKVSPWSDESNAQPKKGHFSPWLPVHWGNFFSQVFPDGREISRPKQTATFEVCHRLQGSLPNASVATATGGGGRGEKGTDISRSSVKALPMEVLQGCNWMQGCNWQQVAAVVPALVPLGWKKRGCSVLP